MGRKRVPEASAGAALRVRPLTRADWPQIERLFGPRGACGGCWCMHWRVRGAKAWLARMGVPNRRAFRRLVEGGGAQGVLAFAESEPVGWCAVGPKSDLEKLAASRVLETRGGERPWAVSCFYIPAAWRGRGVATALLRGAVDLARERGAELLEGYPVPPRKRLVPAAFAWTGVPALFERTRFKPLANRAGMRPIYVRKLRRRA